MKYLTKHLTEAAYEAAASSLAKPHVALTADDNKVHYMPNATPSLSVVAVYDYEDNEVELPYDDMGSYLKIRFNRPINFNELLDLKIEAREEYGGAEGYYAHTANVEDNSIYWTSNDTDVVLTCNEFEGTTSTIELYHGDYSVKYNRFYFE